MFKNLFIYALAAATLFSSHAFAIGYPESFAFDASMEAVGQVLSSPALPSLDNEGFSIAPLYGIVKIEGVDQEATLENGDPLKVENRGELNGQIAGLSMNYSGKGDFGLFAITAWSKVSGDMSSTTQNSYSTDIRDIDAQSFIGAFGATYRFIGDAKSTFAMGIFGGPAFITSTTSSKIHHSDGVSKVSLDPSLSGYYLGLQFVVRLGFFRINPYLNILGNPNVQCMQPTYSGDAYPSSAYNKCENGEHGINTMAVVAGSGINVGYGRFQFGLMTNGGAGSMALKTTPLMISFRIGL